MVNPKIVYCDKNHIYDAAIDKDCPYCKKIEEEHRRLSKIVHESEWIYENENEEYTELIDYKGQDEDEYTELIGHKRNDEEADVYSDEEDDKTESLKSGVACEQVHIEQEISSAENYVATKNSQKE